MYEGSSHIPLHDPVEIGALVSETVFSGAEGAEVLCCFRDDLYYI
jgi:hypothetical protein